MLTGTSCISFIVGGDNSFSGIFSFPVFFLSGVLLRDFWKESFVVPFYSK